MNSTEMLQSLVSSSFNYTGLYCFVNNPDNKVYVTQSDNVLRSFLKHIDWFNTNTHPNTPLLLDFLQNKLQCYYLQACPGTTEIARRIKVGLIQENYLKGGYTLYNKHQPFKLLTETDILDTSDENKGYRHKVIVYVRSNTIGTKSRVPVGVFHTIDQANRFINKYYPPGFIEIKTCSNRLSKQHLGRIKKDTSKLYKRS